MSSSAAAPRPVPTGHLTLPPPYQSSQPPLRPPYPFPFVSLGGLPSPVLDIPVSAVLLSCFLATWVAHTVILRRNLRGGHRFLLSGPLCGHSMMRILALSMRIVWAAYPTNASIALAACLIVQVGSAVLLVVTLLLAQRLLPLPGPLPFKPAGSIGGLGFHKSRAAVLVSIVLSALVMGAPIAVALMTFAVLHMAYTTDAAKIQADHTLLLCCMGYIALMGLASFLVAAGARCYDRCKSTRTLLVLGAAGCLALAASWRTGSAIAAPRMDETVEMPWNDHQAIYYLLNFAVEWAVSVAYLVLRVDLRFYIPEHGSSSSPKGAGFHAEVGPGKHEGGDSCELISFQRKVSFKVLQMMLDSGADNTQQQTRPRTMERAVY